ncbi:hypothetical protein CC86DRAFT_63176 [Ophiobolus disseminans]|uniref:Uncharacterized protein n=1 Tax=Ophiobolus disseminans TaxID=1469910 RepID=A0A6A6ZT68_9PLEO|nr:hypothetical protein CC86DRAFT_63176 [Ophiobolus disseminans]
MALENVLDMVGVCDWSLHRATKDTLHVIAPPTFNPDLYTSTYSRLLLHLTHACVTFAASVLAPDLECLGPHVRVMFHVFPCLRIAHLGRRTVPHIGVADLRPSAGLYPHHHARLGPLCPSTQLKTSGDRIYLGMVPCLDACHTCSGHQNTGELRDVSLGPRIALANVRSVLPV